MKHLYFLIRLFSKSTRVAVLMLATVLVTSVAHAGNVQKVTVGAFSPAAPTPGTTSTATVTAERNGNAVFDAVFAISGAPAGVTASFNPSQVSFTRNQDTRSSTMTVSVASNVTPGIYTVTIMCTATSNSSDRATASFTLTVAKSAQTINFPTPSSRAWNSPAFAPSATSTSALPVSYSIVSGPATLAAGLITLTGMGNVTVRASQAGNAFFNAAASVDRTFAVTAADQAINFAAIGTRTAVDPAFALSATATSALPVTFEVVSGPAAVFGNMLTVSDKGTVVVKAIQAGNALWRQANSVTQSFSVVEASQSISFPTLPNLKYGDKPYALVASASSGLTVNFDVTNGPAMVSGGFLHLMGAGQVTVVASQTGNSKYAPATEVTQTVQVTLPGLIAHGDVFYVDKNTTFRTTKAVVRRNDTDNYAKVVLYTHGNVGTVELESDGTITYTPKAGFIGTDTCTYILQHNLSRSEAVTITFVVRPATPPLRFIY